MTDFCIFGPLCPSSAKKVSDTFVRNFQEQLTTTLVTQSKTSGSYAEGRQSISFKNARIYCKLPSISQVMVAEINLDRLSKSMDDVSVKQMVRAAAEKAVQSDLAVKTAFLGNATNTSDQSRTYNENISRLVDTYSYNDFTQDMQTVKGFQELTFEGATLGDPTHPDFSQPCFEGGISQNMVLKIAAKMITERILSRVSANSGSYDFKLTEETKQVGESKGIGDAISGIIGSALSGAAMFPLLIGGGILLFILILLVFIYFAFFSAPAPTTGAYDIWL